MQKNTDNIPYITAEIAQKIDDTLMSTFNYSIDQLMEIAGITIATVILKSYPTKQTILLIAGSGNNGGDGLVASRYLKEFGFTVQIFYPKQGKNDWYQRWVNQCLAYEIPFVDDTCLDRLGKYDLIIDAIFGFSFKGDIRAPYDRIINSLKNVEDKILSVDNPSGWDIEKGNWKNTFVPFCLVSWTLPKLGCIKFEGQHYLGGRFVPGKLFKDFGLNVEQSWYEGSKELFVKLK